ncbi:polyprenyl synthetase family protein [uncultured Fibrobacter sp.]|uniref:polyprenyl synthetase family protein n=1 Tax=uncultured Fibrobacter sp. TaxID=261512 RepID=UPI002639C77B|nr:polyprenyl synthetase family protein [uncultured Fibrobacter sp.]
MAPIKEDFQAVLTQARGHVADLLKLTEEVIFGVAQNAPVGIRERLESLFQRKGKRIRSTLLCLLAQCGNEQPDSQRVARACAGIELLHLASLVHDDIIDNTDIRRGQKTAHKEWGTQVAVLIGDYVLSQSMQCVIDEESHDIPIVLSKAADKLIEGEILELDHSGNTRLSFEMYDRIIDGKTAALIKAAAKIGAILAGFDKDTIDRCAEMGAHFGIAFQIVDDLLDYGYGSKNLDKAKFTDLANGLITLPLLYYFDRCNSDERAEMENLINRASDDNVPQEIIEKLKVKKAFDKAKATAQDHLEKALVIAETLPSNLFTDEIVAMFSSMSDRGN